MNRYTNLSSKQKEDLASQLQLYRIMLHTNNNWWRIDTNIRLLIVFIKMIRLGEVEQYYNYDWIKSRWFRKLQKLME